MQLYTLNFKVWRSQAGNISKHFAQIVGDESRSIQNDVCVLMGL